MNSLLGETVRYATACNGAARKVARVAVVVAAAALLTACATVSSGGGGKQAPVSQTPTADAAKAQTVKIAVLLPLSGQNAALGRALLNAAEMAMFDLADDKLELVPRDTGGSPQGAAAAAQKAAAEGASLLVGPLFAPEAAAVRPIAAAAGIDMLTFSTDRRLAAPGSHVMGLTPTDQIMRIVAHVRAAGATRLAVLAPRTPYGDVAAAAAQDAAARFGLPAPRIERYDANLADLTVPATAAATAAPAPQAILLAEGGRQAQALAQALTAAGVNQTQTRLLGTALWDEPGMGGEPALVGGRFAAPDPALRRDFEARYKSLFGEAPPRIATLAYDAAALAASVARNAQPGRPLDKATLTAASGFSGVDGLFRLRNDGAVERGLAVLEVTADGVRTVDPAPQNFNVPGQ